MPNVLVVDDSAVDRRLVSGLLGKGTMLSVETADNGAHALARLMKGLPDVVVTDLQMPDMDGLALIKHIRANYPRVPVILMTAHGSEELAVEALEAGAASYVPKSQLADALLDTVEQVMAIARADRNYDRLTDCMVWTEFAMFLENDAALIDPLVDAVQQVVERMHLCDATGRVRIGVALEEALLNALYRGNLELGFEEMQEDRANLLRGMSAGLVEQRRGQAPYCDRKIFVRVQVSKDEARLVVRDDGRGFAAPPFEDGADPAAVVREGGRGLVLMKAFMDQVSFNDTGNEVTLVKRRELNGQHASAS